MTAKYYVYILLCDNGSLYTGYTTNLEKRFNDHLNGSSKYTRSFKPIEILQSWCFGNDKSMAMKAESYIKKLSRTEKQKLVTEPNLISKLFSSN